MNITQNKQLKIRFYTNGNKIGLEELCIIDNTNNKHISKTFEVGTIIISIINNYNVIIKTLDKYIDKMDKNSALSVTELVVIFQKLYNKLKGITAIPELLEISFYSLQTRIENTVKYDNFADEEYSKFQGNIYNLYIRKNGFSNHLFKNFLNEFKQSLAKMKELTENTFDIGSNQEKFDYYAKVSAQLPKMSIEYIENVKSGVQAYTYDINNIEDLFISCIYNLHLSNKFILKCKYCNNLFVPKTNKRGQKYCYAVDEHEEYTCRNKGRKNMYYKRMRENQKGQN